MAAKMVSLQLSKKEAKAEYGMDAPSPASSTAENLPRYASGTKVCLEGEALEKLAVAPSDFKIGETFEITCKVEVVGVRESKTQGGKERNELELQITDMLIDDKRLKKTRAEDKQLAETAGADETD